MELKPSNKIAFDRELSKGDWKEILKGAKSVTYNVSDVIIQQGTTTNKIYVVNQGRCRFERCMNGSDLTILAYIPQESLFGEISFIAKCNEPVSVIVDTPDTSISILESYFLNVLFKANETIAGRFFHYLAYLAWKRWSQFEINSDTWIMTKKQPKD